jgi:hypothetical protein
VNAVVTQKLRSIIQENGRAVVRSPKLCEAIMAGELADFASSARVLRMALRCGIPAALAEGARAEDETAGFTHSLQRQGVSELAAHDAIETWAQAIGTAPARTMEASYPVRDSPPPATPAATPLDGSLPTHKTNEVASGALAETIRRVPWRWLAAILLISLGAGACAGGVWPLAGVLSFLGFSVAPWH